MKRCRLRPILLAGAILWLAGGSAAASTPAWQVPWESGAEAREVIPIGLPSVTQAIAQTPDGFLWFASMNGLFRYDGERPTVMAIGRAGPAVRDLLATRDGALWVAAGGAYLDLPTRTASTYRVGLREGAGGLLRIEQGRVEEILAPNGTPAHWIWSMAELGDGRLALGTEGGLWVLSPRGKSPPVRIHLPGQEANDEFVPAVVVKGEGEHEALWIATVSGVWRWLTHGRAPPSKELATTSARSLVANPEGFWVVQDDRLVRVRDGQAVETIHAAPGEQLRCALDDGSEEAWVGTTFGLRRLRGTTLVPATEALPRQSIRSLLRDREGSLWAAVKGGGVAQLRTSAIRQLGVREGLPTDAAWSLLAAPTQNELWLATGKGMVKVADGAVSAQAIPPDAPNWRLRFLAHQRDGSLWLGGDELVHFGGGRTLFRLTHEEIGGEVRALHVDAQDDVWVGLEPAGLVHLQTAQGQRRIRYGVDEGLCPGMVTEIKPGAGDALWVLGNGGVAHFDRRTRRGKCLSPREPSALFMGVAEEPTGTVWVTAVGDTGLYRIKGQEVTRVPTNPSFPPRALYAVLPDGHGNLWFTSYQGVFRVSAAEIDLWTDGRGPAPVPFHVDHEAGMRSSDCQSMFSPTIVPWGDGGVMVATALGVVAIKPPEALPKPRIEPFIESIIVDAMPLNEEGVVPAATRRVEIKYAAPTYLAVRQPRFEQRIDGLDADWRSLGQARSVLLTKPGPGEYTFRLRVAGLYGQSAPQAWAHFRVQAPWYARGSTLLAAVGLLVLLLFFAYRLRMRRLDARFQAISNERIRIAREWHDGLSQVFLGIGYQLQALRMRLFPNGQTAPDAGVVELLDETKKMVKEAQEEVKAVLWDLRARNGENAFMQAFRVLADETQERFGVVVEFRSTGLLPKTGPLTEEWPRIAREAITNAIKHGEATKVRIALEFTEEKATMTIDDNGRGIVGRAKNDRRGPSFGVIGMRERAARCGGQLALAPLAEGGTRVTVVVESPLHASQTDSGHHRR